jgi:hypothetical protein
MPARAPHVTEKGYNCVHKTSLRVLRAHLPLIQKIASLGCVMRTFTRFNSSPKTSLCALRFHLTLIQKLAFLGAKRPPYHYIIAPHIIGK